MKKNYHSFLQAPLAHIEQILKKSPQPTPWNHKRYNGMQTGIAQALDGSSRGLNTASMPADTAQANQGAGKVPKPILASLWNTPARKLGKASSKMVGRHNGVRDQALHSRKQQTARSHSVHKCLSHQRPYRWGFTVKQGVSTIHEDSAADNISTSSLTV